MPDPDEIHDGDRIATLETIGEQASELHDQPDVTVTCPCGVSGPIERMYQCYYCDVHFCPDCASDHFPSDPEASAWICMPCHLFPPDDRSGVLTVHSDQDHFRVWCPWCGDAMERVAELRELGSLAPDEP